MTRKSALFAGLGVALLFGVGAGGFWFSSKVDSAEQENKALVTRQAALTTEVAFLRKQLAESQVASSQVTSAPKAQDTQKASPENPAWNAWRRNIAPFRHKTMLRNYWYRYHEALTKFNLPPDVQAHVLDLMVSKNESWMDSVDAANAQGITDQKLIQAASKQATDDINTEIAGILGPDGLADVNRAQELRGQQDFIKSNVGADFQMGGVPLTPNQEEGMAQVMLDVSKKYGNQNQNFFLFGTPADASSMPDADAAVLDGASKVLSAQQMTVLNDYLLWNDQRVKVTVNAPK